MNCRIMHRSMRISMAQLVESLSNMPHPLVIGIDGKAGAGKTTLACYLAGKLQANAIPLDDFFLPQELRTPNRYREIGGNIHHERVLEQVILPLKDRKDIFYQPFDCVSMSLLDAKEYRYNPITILEGSYSHHPKLEHIYNVKIFCDIPHSEQRNRICARNGSEGLEQFVSKWIPLEEKYFAHYQIASKSDYIYSDIFTNI